MPSISPIGSPGKWFKGSLHTQTTESDGKLTPAENMQWHTEHDYDFVGITDRNVVTIPQGFLSPTPLLAIFPALKSRRSAAQWTIR
ncbi:MAG: hypothetical protein ABSG98_10810 [Anaerolineales bacterium]|jgi:hypothetical protein